MTKILNPKLARNLALLVAMSALVLGTHVARSAVQPEGSKRQQNNKYLEMLYGGDILGNRVDKIIDEYHKTINDIFNKRIEILTEKLSEVKDPKAFEALIAPPELEKDKDGQPTRRKPCKTESSQQNLSTYCLSQDVTNEYFDFREALLAAREQTKNAVLDQLPADSKVAIGELPDINKASKGLTQYGAVIEKIDLEIDTARQSLDYALAAYNELQMALPLHYKYMEVVSSLERYRDKVSAIRKEVELYPPAFLNTTTTSCT